MERSPQENFEILQDLWADHGSSFGPCDCYDPNEPCQTWADEQAEMVAGGISTTTKAYTHRPSNEMYAVRVTDEGKIIEASDPRHRNDPRDGKSLDRYLRDTSHPFAEGARLEAERKL